MREKSRRKWELAGFFFTTAAGTLLHFLYDWSGGSAAAAVFGAVNESVWEHMKLLAVPWLLWTVLAACRLRRADLPARAAGLLAGLVLIPVLYYTYTGALGLHNGLVNVLIFQAAVLLACAVSWRLQKGQRSVNLLGQAVAGAILLGLAALFVWWTFAPPQLPLFVDPSTGLAGRRQ